MRSYARHGHRLRASAVFQLSRRHFHRRLAPVCVLQRTHAQRRAAARRRRALPARRCVQRGPPLLVAHLAVALPLRALRRDRRCAGVPHGSALPRRIAAGRVLGRILGGIAAPAIAMRSAPRRRGRRRRTTRTTRPSDCVLLGRSTRSRRIVMTNAQSLRALAVGRTSSARIRSVAGRSVVTAKYINHLLRTVRCSYHGATHAHHGAISRRTPTK